MDKSIILELAGSGICYLDKIHMHGDEEYDECYDEFEKIIDKLCEGLPKEERRDIENRLFMAQGGMEARTADEYFKEGFKLALRLAAQNLID